MHLAMTPQRCLQFLKLLEPVVGLGRSNEAELLGNPVGFKDSRNLEKV
jgi:hypothetical protein